MESNPFPSRTSTTDFGLIASELAWDAVLNGLGAIEEKEA
jgi:hypothetical protein